MEQLGFSFTAPDRDAPPPRRPEPALWISRLVLLREPRLAEDALLRDIRLRRGLNVLWAPPAATGDASRLFEGKIAGHTAGKTTFCRLIRYLLGEPRFGTARNQRRIRDRFPGGWVAGEVLVRGERWAVGRPFAVGVHPFAARGLPLEQALGTHEGYQDFLDALTGATVGALPVQSLPHAGQPIDWPLLLTWLARDQEARFADVVAWRHPASDAQCPSPKTADRHVVLRAVLDLMSDDEADFLEQQESLKQRRKQVEDEALRLRRRADGDRRRLATRLDLSPDAGDAGPLFADRLRARVEADRAAMERDERALEERQAGVDLLFQELLATRSAPRGRCNVLLSVAVERGCPLATPAPASVPANRPHSDGDGDLEAAHRARRDEYLRNNAELLDERVRLARRRAAIEELERLHADLGASHESVQESERDRRRLDKEAEQLSQRKAARQRGHAEAAERLSARFNEVVQAVLGRDARGSAAVAAGEIELHIAERGERDGAAMDTLKVLALDLAALALALDGHGHFPGLLIHDGPREADMDESIYARLFLYAAKLEHRFPGEPGFQYIVTTTAPPPKEVRCAPWLLEPQLDASVAEGRLLKTDL